jgi:hypothetical protein
VSYQPRELRGKADAQVVRTEPLDATRRMQMLNTETIGHASPHMVAAMVAKLERRGEVSRVTGAITRNPQTNRWEMRVVRHRPPRPAWRLPVLIAVACLVVVALLICLLLSLIATIAAIPIGAIGVGVLVGAGALRVVRPGRRFSGTFQGRMH